VSTRKNLVFGVIYGAILTVVTLAGIEVVASFQAPSWPARALRVVPATKPVPEAAGPFAQMPWLAEPYNSWGMRDVERTLARPASVDRRIVFVGDSFVESIYTRLSLPAAVDRHLGDNGRRLEMINLGVAATSPSSYYFRLRDVALDLRPDAVLLFFYSGNDFIRAGFDDSIVPKLIDESPGGALLGSIMPRTSWLLVNRLKLADLLKAPASGPREVATLDRIVHGPPAERLPSLAGYLKQAFFPGLSEAEIAEVLSRDGNRFWNELDQQPGDRELLLPWALADLVWRETDPTAAAPMSVEEAVRLTEENVITASLSWLTAADRLARGHGVPLKVFVVPTANIDPEFVDFWKSWPRAFAWNRVCDDRERRLVARLRTTTLDFVNLRDDLAGVAGTYRKRDGHWTEKGLAIVANRVARELRNSDLASR
jgi:hypothetical protein